MHQARAMWTLFEPLHAVTYFAPRDDELALEPWTLAGPGTADRFAKLASPLSAAPA